VWDGWETDGRRVGMEVLAVTIDAALSELDDARKALDLVREQLVEARAEVGIGGAGHPRFVHLAPAGFAETPLG
jgi:hypothetical protein